MCVLDYHERHVTVNDVVYERDGSEWVQHVSSYEKLRILPDRVRDFMVKTGFTIEECTVSQGIAVLRGIKK